MAAILAMAVAANYKESAPPSAKPEKLTGVATEGGNGKTVLRGALSGMPRGDQSAGRDARGAEGVLRPLASLDVEWRDLLAKRRSKQRPLWASIWKFITGGEAVQAEKEEGSIFGEKADEAFFVDMETLLAKWREEARPDAARVEEEAEARAASATFRAALLATLVNHHQTESLAGTDGWQAMSEAAMAPINVAPQGEGFGLPGDSAGVATGFSTGDGGFVASNAPSFPPGSPAGDAGGSLGGGGSSSSSATGSLLPPTPAPDSGSGAFVSQPAVQQHPVASTHHSTAESHVAPTSSSGSTPTSAPAVPTSATANSAVSNAVSPTTTTVVSSQFASSVSSQTPSASPATVPAAAQPTTIYVSNFGAGTLNEYDQLTGNPTAGFTPISLSMVASVVVANNTLYVATFNGTVGTYNLLAGAAINANLITGVNQLEGMAVSANAIYVTSFGNGVEAFNATTGSALAGFSPVSIQGPRGITISGNHLYVVSNINNTVSELDATTGAAVAGFNTIGGFAQASAVTVSGNTLYVDDISFNQIGEYDATTGATIKANWASSSGTVFQLSILGNDLYVPEFSNGALVVYNLTTGTAETNYTSPSGLNKPFGAAAIPEPGSAVLLMAGVAVYAGRRRRESVPG